MVESYLDLLSPAYPHDLESVADTLEVMVALFDDLADIDREQLDQSISKLRDEQIYLRGSAGTDGVVRILKRIECLIALRLSDRVEIY